MKKWIGIDLGTTNTVASYFDVSSKIILNERGERITPSIVSFSDKDVFVGSAAKNQILVNPQKTFYNFKTNIGSNTFYKVDDEFYRAEYISAHLLSSVKKNAEKFLDEEIENVVITVPAYFSEIQRRGVVEAANFAGLNCKAILNEPTAAAIAYAFERQIDGIFLIYDLGGGTFDVTLMEKQSDTYTVLSVKGQSRLGGNDFNKIIENHVLDSFKNEYPDFNLEDVFLLEQLRERIEEGKKNLSVMEEVDITLLFLDGKHLNYKLKRNKFNAMISEYIDKTIHLSMECIADAGVDISSISKIILSGGSTRIPLIQKVLKESFPSVSILDALNQDEVVAIGAGIHAFSLSRNDSIIKFKDVTPYSLGLEIRDNEFFTLIERNTALPISRSKLFTTTNDYQDEIEIHVLQGEYKKASLNYSIGRFSFGNIQKALKGIPKIEVLFTLNESGILSVNAKDLETNSSNFIKIKITSSSDNVAKESLSNTFTSIIE
ncbi:Hsp70 family protein [Borreliella garinii]|uniref:Hsp70 family protein n=1 Tax=Borreliella garinii TaxID=29519 RepID=UPI0004D79DEB|nr:Hsp70 family protein [Borreliella garinii]KEO62229.1 heat shock protein Hsp70 [Borreliella garinii]